jgi:hypothetical protein
VTEREKSSLIHEGALSILAEGLSRQWDVSAEGFVTKDILMGDSLLAYSIVYSKNEKIQKDELRVHPTDLQNENRSMRYEV